MDIYRACTKQLFVDNCSFCHAFALHDPKKNTNYFSTVKLNTIPFICYVGKSCAETIHVAVRKGRNKPFLTIALNGGPPRE